MKRYLIGLVLLMGCGREVSTITGPPGPQGDKGDTGAQGVKGDKGTSCSVHQDTHGATVSCTDGTTGVVVNGMDASPCGVSSVPGGVKVSCPDGSIQTVMNGTNGTNGTVVTPIQLCSQYTTTYPSSFPEFGFCINNKLFAVYWDGTHAFEAEIVPGNYYSTSPQTCTFHVAAQCVVTQ